MKKYIDAELLKETIWEDAIRSMNPDLMKTVAAILIEYIDNAPAENVISADDKNE